MDKSEKQRLLKEKAKKHTGNMQYKYEAQTKSSIERSIIFSPEDKIKIPSSFVEPEIKILPCGTTEAAGIYKNCVVLNFASYKNPGGGFMNGRMAQEEALCHDSNLYNILSAFSSYYEWNKKNTNNGLYLNRLIYTPDVVFCIDNRWWQSDVITCAAPNWSAAKDSVTMKENLDSLRSRVRMILDTAMLSGKDTVILGAYGCGVFGQDPTQTAAIFLEEIQKGISIKNIIFAIPKGNGNFDAFKKVLM